MTDALALALGIGILVAIFVGVFTVMVSESGWRIALSVWGITFALCGLVALAAFLIERGVS